MSDKHRSFIKGAAILAGAGLIAKILGAFFRIALVNTIGTVGVGYYQKAYPIYALLLMVSTAGLPVAISKMVSESIAIGNPTEARRIFRVSLRLLFIIGLLTSVILFAISPLIAKGTGDDRALYAIMSIAPALFVVSMMSAYRGYFQGMHHMTPTAISQIVEQSVKFGVGIGFAIILYRMYPDNVEYAAAGAIIGVTISEIVSLFVLMGIYSRKKKSLQFEIARQKKVKHKYGNPREVLKKIVMIAVPVTVGASIMPLVNFIDTAIVGNRLLPILDKIKGIPLEGVLDSLEAKKTMVTGLFGILTGVCNSLVNFPAIITISLAMSLVPAISASYSARDTKSIKQKSITGIRLSLLVGVPAAAGLAVLAEPILMLLYKDMELWQYNTAAPILSLLSVGVIFLTLVQTLTAILQGIGRIYVPVKNLLIGAIFKIVITYVLTGNPEWHVRGAAMGTVVCYGIAALLNFIAVLRYTKIRFKFVDFIIKPVIATGAMAAASYYSYSFLFDKLGSTNKALIITIILAICVYSLMLLITRSIKREDLTMIKGGKRLSKILNKLHLIS